MEVINQSITHDPTIVKVPRMSTEGSILAIPTQLPKVADNPPQPAL